MQYLSITFPQDLRKQLDSQAKREGLKRSTLIQKAVRVYLHLQQKRATDNLLREGYQEMYGERQNLLKEFEDLDHDSLKYLD